MKYIDADKLIAEIERRKYEVFPTNDGKVRVCSTPDQIQSGWLNALKWVRKTITSLQQEQPELDLEKEVDRFLKSEESTTYENAGSYKVTVKDPKKIARHFYELGLTAK